MSHLAIYRKYRPSNFDEASGQKVITTILKNAIKALNIQTSWGDDFDAFMRNKNAVLEFK